MKERLLFEKSMDERNISVYFTKETNNNYAI